MAKLNPYLNFENNCREAMNFYKDCFGGEVQLQTVGEMPEMAAQMPPEFKDAIMHSSLTSDAVMLMGSDLNMDKRIEGNTVQICVSCNSEDEITTFFEKMSQGGTVKQPLNDVPWGAKFGALVDKYNKYWMFNYMKS